MTVLESRQFFDLVGAWRSLVARTLGVREVAGSNPAAPTNSFYIRFFRLPCEAELGGCTAEVAE